VWTFANIPGSDTLVGISVKLNFNTFVVLSPFRVSKLSDAFEYNRCWNSSLLYGQALNLFSRQRSRFAGNFPLLHSTDGSSWTRLNVPGSCRLRDKNKRSISSYFVTCTGM